MTRALETGRAKDYGSHLVRVPRRRFSSILVLAPKCPKPFESRLDYEN